MRRTVGSAGSWSDSGAAITLQPAAGGPDGAAACVAVYVTPAITTVPVRGVWDGFAATCSVTVPSPVPPAPAPTVIQDTWLAALQVQPLCADTVT